ncbi:hypothetical protein MRX96_041441 [Rhipicephalus microplus]
MKKKKPRLSAGLLPSGWRAFPFAGRRNGKPVRRVSPPPASLAREVCGCGQRRTGGLFHALGCPERGTAVIAGGKGGRAGPLKVAAEINARRCQMLGPASHFLLLFQPVSLSSFSFSPYVGCRSRASYDVAECGSSYKQESESSLVTGSGCPGSAREGLTWPNEGCHPDVTFAFDVRARQILQGPLLSQ